MKRFISVLLIFILLKDTALVDPVCSDYYLITDFSQKTCVDQEFENSTYFYKIETKTCLPYCAQYKYNGHRGDVCPCPPGYDCKQKCKVSLKDCTTNADCLNVRDPCTGQCAVGHGSCMTYHANTFDFRDTFYSALKFKPECDNIGNWLPKQCKGGLSGRCFCYDSQGNRIFGQALYSDADDMTCACSRKKAELEASGKNYVTFHCDSKGNYENIQCDRDSGLCWCVEPKTGELSSPVVPEKAMPKLPCYKASDMGGQYLRKCDSVQYARAYIENLLTIRGMQYVNLGNIQCDGDGAYGKYNITEGIAKCTSRDGKQIGSWQSDASTDIALVTCNCARDYQMYSHQLTCNANGNYVDQQAVISKGNTYYYCVDTDGFPKSDMYENRTAVANCTMFY